MIRQSKLLIVLCILLATSLAFGQSNYEKRIQDACPAAEEQNFAEWKKGLMSDFGLLLINLTITYKETSENPATFLTKDEKVVTGIMVSGIMTITAYCYTPDNFKKRFISKKLLQHFFNRDKVERVTMTGQEDEFKNGWDDSISI